MNSITVSSTVLNSVLLKFYKSYPQIKLNLLVNNTSIIENSILENKLDIALVEGKTKSENLKVINVMKDEVVFVCGMDNKMAHKKSITLEEIASCALNLREEGSGTRKELLTAFKAKNINNLNIVGESSSYEAIIKAVKVNLGVSVLSKRLVIEDFQKGDIWMCPISDFNSERKFSIIYHKDKFLSDDMNLFIKNCTEVASYYQMLINNKKDN